MSRVFDFSSWSAEAIRARLSELRSAKAEIESEELALIGALERLRHPVVAPASGGAGSGGDEGGAGGADGASSGGTDSLGVDFAGGSGGAGAGGSSITPGQPILDLSPGSAVEVLTEDAQMSSRSAMATVSLAVALERLPLIADAFGKGEISREVVQELAKFATSESEAELLALARNWSASDAIRHRRAAVAITRQESRKIRESRELRLRWSSDRSSVEIFGRLEAIAGAKLDAALAKIVASIPKEVAGERVPYKSRLADALVELAGYRIGSDSDPDRVTLSVHVDYETLVAGNGEGEGEGNGNGEITSSIGVGYVSAEIARRIACDPRLEVVIDGPDGLPLGIGRTSRKIPPWLSRQIRYRDKVCVHPGCERAFGLEVHHIIPWADGGPTDYDNLALICWYHHQMIHEGGWTLVGTVRDGLVFEGIWGERIEVAPWVAREPRRKRGRTQVA